jgi:RimJ/RimL family protein N-acetyltransferase
MILRAASGADLYGGRPMTCGIISRPRSEELPLPFDVPVLQLERVCLRPLDERHVDGVFAMYSSEAATQYLARPRMAERKQAAEMIAKAQSGYAEGTVLRLAIEHAGGGEFLGECLLFNFNKESRRAEIGYSLLPPHWSRGYISEALPALIDQAFGPMGLNRLEADIDPANAASKRVLERHGFTFEGLLRERWIVRGQPSDSAMFGLLARQWRAPRPR